jgi:hypothetical protein
MTTKIYQKRKRILSKIHKRSNKLNIKMIK